MPEQLASEIPDDATSTSDLRASFPDTAAFTDLMNIPLFGLSRSGNRVYHIIWSSLVLWVGEAPWTNSFQCKQKFKLYLMLTRSNRLSWKVSSWVLLPKMCWMQRSGTDRKRSTQSSWWCTQESYEDAQKRSTWLFNVLLNWGSFAQFSRHDRQQDFISCPWPLPSVDSLLPNSWFPWLSPAGQLLALLACYLSTGLGNETVVSYLHFCGNLRQAHLLRMSSSTSWLVLWMLKDNMKEQWEVII